MGEEGENGGNGNNCKAEEVIPRWVMFAVAETWCEVEYMCNHFQPIPPTILASYNAF